jgi:hypothetical protein
MFRAIAAADEEVRRWSEADVPDQAHDSAASAFRYEGPIMAECGQSKSISAP